MRKDEQFVRDCMVGFLGEKCVDAIPGEDPPDYYFICDDRKIAVEITQLTPVTFDEHGSPKNRWTEDIFSENLCDKLEKKFKPRIKDGHLLLIHIRGPIAEPRKFKRQTETIIRQVIEETALSVGWENKYEIAGETVTIKVLPAYPASEKGIAGLVENRDSNAFIQDNAKVILAERIRSKYEKMKETPWQGTKWLALLNRYWLADHETYRLAIADLNVIHDFEKIFLISEKGDVNLIFERA